MSDPLADLEREITARLDQLDRLYEEAAVIIDAIDDPSEAFAQATAFSNKARVAYNEATSRFHELRARQAARIMRAESLSLAKLADRISVSKARADQLVRAAAVKAKPHES